MYLGKYDSPENHAQYRRVIAQWLANTKVDTRPTLPDEPKRINSVDELLMAFLDHAKSYYVRDVTQP